MMIKKVIVIILAIVSTCFSISTSVFAEITDSCIDDEAIPAYEIAEQVISSLSMNGTTANMVSSADCTNIVKITVTHTLQKHFGLWIWNDVDGSSSTKTVNSKSIRLSSTTNVIDSGTYRVEAIFTFTKSNGETETITKYSNEVNV